MIGLTVLGSTGSIGLSTLDVVSRHPECYQVVALTAHRNVERMLEQCRTHRPQFAVMVDHDAAERLRSHLVDESIEVLSGVEGLERVAAHPEADAVMAAIVGAAGLAPALAAVRAGKKLLLANKEALVVSGHLFMEEADRYGATILPIDSEHNAIFQCMPTGFAKGLREVGVSKILLTASGGPFRTSSRDELLHITPEQACAHPNWVMGRKISVDSATMMNKGLEVIEACWLFNTGPERIDVVVHPQSVIHSMVQYVDGSVLAELGHPDMRTPIAHALAWPDRIESGVADLDLFEIARLDFEPPDLERFPCLALAYRAVEAGGGVPAILNAANEVAVEAFLQQRLRFIDIPALIEVTMAGCEDDSCGTIDSLIDLDQKARRFADLTLAQFS